MTFFFVSNLYNKKPFDLYLRIKILIYSITKTPAVQQKKNQKNAMNTQKKTLVAKGESSLLTGTLVEDKTFEQHNKDSIENFKA